MHKLEKLILEQFASIQEKTDINDLPKEFVAAIEKRYGKMHPKDFFSDDKSRYMKFDGENKTTGQVTHRVIPIASFEKMYDDFQDIVDDIKQLLIKQIESPVRWREIVINMINSKVDKFIEIGPGKVLSGLVKRIDSNVELIQVNELEDINKLN